MELRKDFTVGEVYKYIRGHRGNEWVDVNHHQWGSSALFTTDASSCFVPVVFDGVDLIGMGHYYPSLAIPGTPIMLYQMKPLQDYSSYVRRAGHEIKQGRRLEMYLFGGTVGNEDYLEEVREAVLREFRALGVQCWRIMPPEPQSILKLVVADIRNRTIRCHYKLDN